MQLRRLRKGRCYRVFWRTSRATRCRCSTWLTRPQTDPRDGSRLRCCTLTLSVALLQPYLVAWPLTGSTMLHRRCKQRGSPAIVYLLNRLVWGFARPTGADACYMRCSTAFSAKLCDLPRSIAKSHDTRYTRRVPVHGLRGPRDDEGGNYLCGPASGARAQVTFCAGSGEDVFAPSSSWLVLVANVC